MIAVDTHRFLTNSTGFRVGWKHWSTKPTENSWFPIEHVKNPTNPTTQSSWSQNHFLWNTLYVHDPLSKTVCDPFSTTVNDEDQPFKVFTIRYFFLGSSQQRLSGFSCRLLQVSEGGNSTWKGENLVWRPAPTNVGKGAPKKSSFDDSDRY